jgi:maintenance of morphology protein 1
MQQAIELDLTYTDTATISLSSAVLVNFPKPGFARLPVSLTISLALFAASVRFPVHSPLPLTHSLHLCRS